jgi:hypothetical protein
MDTLLIAIRYPLELPCAQSQGGEQKLPLSLADEHCGRQEGGSAWSCAQGSFCSPPWLCAQGSSSLPVARNVRLQGKDSIKDVPESSKLILQEFLMG